MQAFAELRIATTKHLRAMVQVDRDDVIGNLDTRCPSQLRSPVLQVLFEQLTNVASPIDDKLRIARAEVHAYLGNARQSTYPLLAKAQGRKARTSKSCMLLHANFIGRKTWRSSLRV